jgi:hypothetical protein
MVTSLMDTSVKHEPCRRPSGSFRAYFNTKEEAETFAQDPANPTYHGDIAHLCAKCGFWHLSRFEWLFPKWESHNDETLN